MKHECSPGKYLAGQASTMGVGYAAEGLARCMNTVSRLARAVFTHHDDQSHNALKQYAAHKGLVGRGRALVHGRRVGRRDRAAVSCSNPEKRRALREKVLVG